MNKTGKGYFQKGHPDLVSEEARKRASLKMRGHIAFNWKGGKIKDCSNGYIRIWKPKHSYSVKNYIPEHRLVFEKAIGRYLKPIEIVHHINEIKNDNRLKNLQYFRNGGAHTRLHRFAKRHNLRMQDLKFNQAWLFN